MEDKELIRRIQNGQKEYLNEIAARYYNDIYYFCAYQTGSREDAYDLAQETFLRFIRYVDSYRYRNLKGYLLTIAMNLCRSYFHESGQRQDGTKFRDELLGSPAMEDQKNAGNTGAVKRTEAAGNAGFSGNAGAYGRLERTQVLAEALRQLPSAQREAVLLHHFYGYKNREIARMTGASLGAVKSRINQGLCRLKDLLDKEDFYE